MSIRPHVAKKYVVEYGWTPSLEEFESILKQIQEIDENIIEWKSEDENSYELSKEVLRKVRIDFNVSSKVREFADNLLKSSDPTLEYVKINLF